MPQLVGTNCVICQQRITNELNARFCPVCGHPRHDGCTRPPDQPTDALCEECGAWVDPHNKSPEPKGPPARPVPPARRGPFPIAQVCPKCACASYRKVKPAASVAFVWDRVCKECKTRYTPPTPLWAALIFLLAGLLLGGGSLVAALFSVAAGDVLGLVCIGCTGVMGCLAIVHGIRTLSNPGKV